MTISYFFAMKKLFAFFLLMFVMSPMVSAQSTERDYMFQQILLDGAELFSDVSATHNNALSIFWMADEGTVEGYSDGTFRPDQPVNRAELMKMVTFESVESSVDNFQNCFPDVTDQWFAPYVCLGYNEGWVEGYPDGNFRPGDNVNRVEAMKIILNALISQEEWPTPTDADFSVEMPADLDMNAWYAGHARFAIVKELVDGWHVTQNPDGTVNYYPADNMTRKEVAEMMFRIMNWMMDRSAYVEIMTEATCYLVENDGVLSEEDLKAGFVAVIEKYGYTEDTMNTLVLKMEGDDVVQARFEEALIQTCGQQEVPIGDPQGAAEIGG